MTTFASRITTATTLAMCALAACGGSSGGGGDDSAGSAVALADAPGQLADASCGYTFRCCTSAEIATQFMGLTGSNGSAITTEAECDSTEAALFAEFLTPEWQASVTAGRISYDGAAMADCISALDSLACGAAGMTSAAASECTDALTPLVASGSACTQDYECIPGACVGASTDGSGATTDGACATTPQLGDACTTICATGLFCDDSTGASVCAMVAANGAACTESDGCTSGTCDTANTMTCVATCTGSGG